VKFDRDLDIVYLVVAGKAPHVSQPRCSEGLNTKLEDITGLRCAAKQIMCLRAPLLH
jgi:hypothetical protein